MSKEIKRISVSAFENIAKQATNESTVVWEGLELNIRSQLPFDEMLAFVNEVATSCFFEDGSYAPEMMDFMIRRGVLYRYANFRLPQDINKQYWLAYTTDAVEFVYNHIAPRQFQAITTAIREKVEHQCDLMVSESQQKLNALLSQFDSFTANMEQAFSNVSPDELRNLVSVINNGEPLSEKKIVEAYADHLRANAGDVDDKRSED